MNVNLSRGYVTRVSRKDYRRVIAAGPWFAHVPLNRKTVYAVHNFTNANGVYSQQQMHRFILRLTDPKVLGDHKDGDGLNNLRSNLRKATPSQSQCNRAKQSNNSTGFSGVSWNKHAEKFEAHVKLHGKKTHLGLFASEKDAAHAVLVAKKKLYKNFVRHV